MIVFMHHALQARYVVMQQSYLVGLGLSHNELYFDVIGLEVGPDL